MNGCFLISNSPSKRIEPSYPSLSSAREILRSPSETHRRSTRCKSSWKIKIIIFKDKFAIVMNSE